jgi:hypothetical protein
MASTIRVFDPSTGRAKNITLDAEQGVLADQPNGALDTYLKLSVSARTVAGVTINPFVISNTDDLVMGTSQYDGSTLPYADLGSAVNDYVLRMVHGIPGQPGTAMDFSS